MGKISSYPAMTALKGPELILGDQSGATGTTTPTAVAAYMAGLTTTPVLASYARTAAEIAAGVTPTNYSYPPGHGLRYGADPTYTTDSTPAIQTIVLLSSLNGSDPIDPTESQWAGYLPPGRYKVSASITRYVRDCLRGDNEQTTIIDGSGMTEPIFVQDPTQTNFQYSQTRRIAVRGGTYAWYFDLASTNVESINTWERVRFEYQTVAAIYCNQYFLLNNFLECAFWYCESALVIGTQANLNNWIACRFEGLNSNSITFSNTSGTNGGEVNTFLGCRFEARDGATGYTLLTVEQGICTLFDGCYFEDTWQHILSETGTANGGSTFFRNCKFTGEENTGSGYQSEIFDSDGVVGFENCFFLTGSSSASTCDYALTQASPGLNTTAGRVWQSQGAMTGELTTGPHIEVTSKPFTPSTGVAVSLCTISRTNTTDSETNNQAVGGTIGIVISGSDTSGNPVIMSYETPFVVTGFSNEIMVATFGTAVGAQNNGPAATLTMGSTGASETEITLTVTLTLSTLGNASARATLRCDIAYNPGYGSPTVQMVD